MSSTASPATQISTWSIDPSHASAHFKVRQEGDALRIEGDLRIHGVTRSVELDVDSVSPATRDPSGNLRMAASATTKIRRKDFGLTWNTALETGGVLVGDDFSIEIDAEFVSAQV